MSTKSAQALHHSAEHAREEKKYQEALSFYAQALFEYGEVGASVKISEIHAGLSITYRHLANQATNLDAKRIWQKQVELSVHASLEMAKLAESQGDPTGLAMAYFNSGKFYEMSQDFATATKMFSQAVSAMETHPPENNNRPAVLWDFKLKLFLAEMQLHQSTDLSSVLTAIEALEKDTGIDSDYNVKVWVSGAYLKLAEYLKNKDPQHAKEFLAKVKEIIEGDKRLVVRNDDYKRVAGLLGFPE